jgi:hypothetical protein
MKALIITGGMALILIGCIWAGWQLFLAIQRNRLQRQLQSQRLKQEEAQTARLRAEAEYAKQAALNEQLRQ